MCIYSPIMKCSELVTLAREILLNIHGPSSSNTLLAYHCVHYILDSIQYVSVRINMYYFITKKTFWDCGLWLPCSVL